MENRNETTGLLQEIGNDPFVEACWKIRIAWFLIRLVAVIIMFIYVVCSK